MANQCDLRPCCTLSSQILNISIDRDSITSLVPILNPTAMTLKKKSGLKSLVPVIRCPFLPLYTPGKRMHQSSLHPTTGEIFQDSSKICLFFLFWRLKLPSSLLICHMCSCSMMSFTAPCCTSPACQCLSHTWECTAWDCSPTEV